jgi:hypothetical protein
MCFLFLRDPGRVYVLNTLNHVPTRVSLYSACTVQCIHRVSVTVTQLIFVADLCVVDAGV